MTTRSTPANSEIQPQDFPAPTNCPFCRSPKIAMPNDKVNASTYWRCEACGEMWNIDRLRESSNRFGDGPRWR